MTFTRSQYALAASLAALMIAAPTAFHVMQRDFQVPRDLGKDAGKADDVISRGLAADEKTKVVPAKPLEEIAAVPPAEPAPAFPESPGQIATAPAPPPPPAALSARKDQPFLVEGGVGRRRLELDGMGTGFQAAPVVGDQIEIERQRVLTDEEYRDKFEAKEVNPVKQVAAEPVSTFSVDVDTASYSFVRRSLNAGKIPSKGAVRVEEMINYFPYDYAKPDSAGTPFKPTVTVVQSPWNPSNQLVHVALEGYDVQASERPRANLVFLIDVSGSMEPADRLPLVKNAFRMLVEELKPDDTVSIVTYASGSGVALEPTKISDKAKILAAIDKLGAGGSTAGAEGIQDAYRLAESGFDKSAVNRVILATDGDFNVGLTDHDQLKDLIERKREKGIFLSILGVGQGNYNDALMQRLAQNGNGTAAYADTLNEARKVLVDEASSTLFPIAKDVKVQIEWNPNRVAEYRLIGYETRALRREDFNNDAVDAGDIGSGHSVTAIYEITPVGSATLVDALRYEKTRPAAEGAEPSTQPATSELGFLKLRYKLPKEETSKLISMPITTAAGNATIDAAPADTRFSVAVAAFGQMLKGSPHLKLYSYDDVIALAQSAKGDDKFGYRAEFINLVHLAKASR